LHSYDSVQFPLAIVPGLEGHFTAGKALTGRIDPVYRRGGFACSGAPDLHANLLKKTAGNDKCIAL
jgi:hypothetical protein